MSSNVQFTYLDRDATNCEPSLLLGKIQQVTFEDFIYRINKDVTRVSVLPLARGRSGAHLFLIRRVADRQRLIPIVIKAADKSSPIIEERKNYEECVKDKLANAPNLLRADSFALGYEYAKGSFEKPATLREGYSVTDSSIISKILEKLVKILWDWYDSFPHEISNIEYMTFSKPLGAIIRDLGTDFSSYMFLEAWWQDFKKLRRVASPYDVYRCHGDLNVGNIMFDMNSADPIPLLIDFGSIGEKIAYWDFAKLERDLKTRLFLKEALMNGQKKEEIINAVRDIDLSQPKPSESFVGPSLSRTESRASECVSKLRNAVIKQTGENMFNLAYYDTLLYSTLTVLYRSEADEGVPLDVQKSVACESACAILSRILQRSLPKSIYATSGRGRIELSENVLDEALIFSNMSHDTYLRLLCEKIHDTSYGDIRYVAIAGFEVFNDESIIKALSDISDRTRSRTLRVYLLKPDTKSFEEFVRLSNEPSDVLKEKISGTKNVLVNLSKSPQHSRLRIKLYFYDSIPSLSLLEVPEGYFFRPYRIGEAVGKFSVVKAIKGQERSGIAQFLQNYLRDLVHHSEETTLRWF